MRYITASAAALLMLMPATAIAKGHDMPADPAQAFGQENADENYIVGGETAAPDANGGNVKGTKTGETGLDGSEQSSAAQAAERDPAAPPKGKPE